MDDLRLDADDLEDPGVWCRQAVEACLEVWDRVGVRYARRMDGADRVRDAEDDVLALAARRVVPLGRSLTRPLPGDTLDPLALHFNRLDPADRFVLRRLDRVTPLPGPRTEHLASAFERLASALDPGPPGLPAGNPQRERPPPGSGDGL